MSSKHKIVNGLEEDEREAKRLRKTLPTELAKKMTDWQRDKITVRERDDYILDNEMYADCTFSIFGDAEEPRLIRCHRLYLAKSSPVFSAMFYGDLKKDLDEVIHLPDVNLEAFRAMLVYIYSGDINLGNYCYEVVCGLLYIAKKYLLPEPLLEEIYGYLWRHMYPDNVWTALEFAENNNEPQLEQTAWEVIGLSYGQCLSVDKFRNISKEYLQRLSSTEKLAVSEIDLFNASARWADSEAGRQGRNPDPGTLREILAPIIPNIRFLTMDGEDFVNHVVPTKILNYEEQCQILCNYEVPNSQKVPETISSEVRLRDRPKFEYFFVYGTPKNKCELCKLKVGDTIDISNSVHLNSKYYRLPKDKTEVLYAEIPTQVSETEDQIEYEESFTVFLLLGKNIIYKEHFSKIVKYNSTTKIKFSEGPTISSVRKLVGVYLVFHKSGRYPFYSSKFPLPDIADMSYYVKDLRDRDIEDQSLRRLKYNCTNFCFNLIILEGDDDDQTDSDD